MFRFIFSLMFYAVIGKWIYAEVQFMCPSMTPAIDRVLHALEIPTHDHWNSKQMQQAFNSLSSAFDQNETSARTSHEDGFGPVLQDLSASFLRATDAIEDRAHGSVERVHIVGARRL